MNVKDIIQLLKPLTSKIQMLVGKATLAALSDSTEVQLIKVQSLDKEVIDEVERIQEFGLSSSPPVGESEVFIAAIGGNRDHVVAVKVDSAKYRPKDLKSGETVLYDKTGSKVYLKEDGSIELEPSNGIFKILGDIQSTGEITALANTTPVNLSTHIHPTPVGPTSPPTPGT